MSECIHEIEASCCCFCSQRQSPAPRGQTAFSWWVTARYPGRCAVECGEKIVSGDLILVDGDGHWLCENCGRSPGAVVPAGTGILLEDIL